MDEIIALLNPVTQREKVLHALFEFQSIPSVGIMFARDLMFLNYYKLSELKDLDGPQILDQYEKKIGYRVDPCVEDQFWLAVHYANNPGSKKQWWDFTSQRKAYRSQHGYPNDRP
jgi:hypothetical protein